MGQRGPKPSPNVVAIHRGLPLSQRPLNLSDGVNPPIQVPSPPKWLSQQGMKEWRRISAELEALGLIARIDMASLATYCQTWGDLAELELAFAAQKNVAKSRAAPEQKDTATAAVYFQKTPTGFLRESALHRKIVEMRNELDRYVKNFGLNPSARARVTASNHVQPDLPGLDAAPTETQGFGQFIRR